MKEEYSAAEIYVRRQQDDTERIARMKQRKPEKSSRTLSLTIRERRRIGEDDIKRLSM